MAQTNSCAQITITCNSSSQSPPEIVSWQTPTFHCSPIRLILALQWQGWMCMF